MSSMTCLACNVSFEHIDPGREHYKTDWHRYNLKRKVSELAPVTLEQFQERLKKIQGQEEPKDHESLLCKPCNKAFNSSNAYHNHLQSKKHKSVSSGDSGRGKPANQIFPIQELQTKTHDVEEMEEDSDAESWDSYDENCLGLEECLFCSIVSQSLQDNIAHMTLNHGFFLPDAEYITDLEGLITYLGEKVGAGHVCLWCNEKGKTFRNAKAVQKHMIDKGHCKMLHDGDMIFEYADYYDYTSSYPDADQTEISGDQVIAPNELENDGFSLTLPSGATIGHRSLMKYYQQNLAAHSRRNNEKALPKMLSHYRALGWTGSTGFQVEKRAKDLQFMQRNRRQFHMKIGLKGNDTLRHRFKDPNGP